MSDFNDLSAYLRLATIYMKKHKDYDYDDMRMMTDDGDGDGDGDDDDDVDDDDEEEEEVDGDDDGDADDDGDDVMANTMLATASSSHHDTLKPHISGFSTQQIPKPRIENTPDRHRQECLIKTLRP